MSDQDHVAPVGASPTGALPDRFDVQAGSADPRVEQSLPTLFPLDEIPEIPLLRPPRRSRGESDARFRNHYPPEWDRCPDCIGRGALLRTPDGRNKTGVYDNAIRRAVVARALPEPLVERGWTVVDCAACLGMGSLKARVRREAGHRCERCQHPYIPKGDAKMLRVAPTPYHWSPCDPGCTHRGPVRWREAAHGGDWKDEPDFPHPVGASIVESGPSGEQICRWDVEAEWRILTVHHLDGDKANCRWWNLAALCQRCHLETQAKVVMERIYPHEHSPWFKLHAAGYYAAVYLNEDVTRAAAVHRLDELLALEYDPGLTSDVKGDPV